LHENVGSSGCNDTGDKRQAFVVPVFSVVIVHQVGCIHGFTPKLDHFTDLKLTA
jgi:hypothetical protein